ncbi:hypothetical protein DESUT3_15060 [Desulfuromonas versatilis]|uniref:DUF309 domain-containing protein n=1 Tax=Desulfuromonas versatilis TaxID=2802975 RepID=A0ABN6DWM9_9BACT|nr:DUF309 domain-containing protein [Desulfuromonas versatilis]BCR04437.1 hypothetical protein DESUT3_15060 [Desulfuromonas versatilis]
MRPPELLLRAIEEFNAGDYFLAHETLEILWCQERGEIRKLYQGILQVGIGLLHNRRGNYRGAVSLLRRGTGYLEPFGQLCLGIDVADLVNQTRRALAELELLGPERFADFDPKLEPRIHLAKK